MHSIGYVVHVKTPGIEGGETRSYQVAQALGRAGADVHLYGKVNNLFAWADRVHPHPLRHPTPLGLVQLTRDFSHHHLGVAIERYQFPLFNVGFMAQQIRNKPIIFEVHGFPIDEFALISQRKDISADRLTKLIARLPRVIWERVQAAMFRRAAHFIVTSAGTKEILTRLGVSGDRISTIYNSVDPSLFDPAGCHPHTARASLNLPPDGKIVLYAGNLFHEELFTIVEAASRVVAIHPSAHFVYVGTGPTAALADLARSTGLSPDQFHLRPSIGHQSMPDLLTAADVVLAPYRLKSERFKMGFHYSPLKVMEALAMEKPVVTVDAPELRTVFEGVPNVQFTVSGRAESWADRIVGALDMAGDPALAQGRAFVMNGYRWQDVAQKYLAIIESVEKSRG